MPDETTQPVQQAQCEPSLETMPEPISSENSVPQENIPTPGNTPEPILEENSQPAEIPILTPEPVAESTPTPSQTQSEPIPETSSPSTNSNITIEKTPDTVTITEVMEPPAPPAPGPEVSKVPFDTKSFFKSLLPKLKEKLFFRTEKRLSKIMDFTQKNGEVQNDEVEKLLHVSDATASRYLAKLVQRGNLKVSGPKNHAKYIQS